LPRSTASHAAVTA